MIECHYNGDVTSNSQPSRREQLAGALILGYFGGPEVQVGFSFLYYSYRSFLVENYLVGERGVRLRDFWCTSLFGVPAYHIPYIRLFFVYKVII